MDSKDDCQLLYTAQKAWGATGNTHNGRADWADQYGSRLLDHIAALDARIDALEGALQDIINPIAAMQRKAEAEGCRLSGMAYSIANNPNHLQRIAKAALGGEQHGG